MYDGDRLVSPGRADFRRASISSDDILVIHDGGEAPRRLHRKQQLAFQCFNIDTVELYMIIASFSSRVNTGDMAFSLYCYHSPLRENHRAGEHCSPVRIRAKRLEG